MPINFPENINIVSKLAEKRGGIGLSSLANHSIGKYSNEKSLDILSNQALQGQTQVGLGTKIKSMMGSQEIAERNNKAAKYEAIANREKDEAYIKLAEAKKKFKILYKKLCKNFHPTQLISIAKMAKIFMRNMMIIMNLKEWFNILPVAIMMAN